MNIFECENLLSMVHCGLTCNVVFFISCTTVYVYECPFFADHSRFLAAFLVILAVLAKVN